MTIKKNSGISKKTEKKKSKNQVKKKTKKTTQPRLKPIKPTRKEKNRYVLFQIIRGINQEEKIKSKEISVNMINNQNNKEFIKKLKSTYIGLFGVFDYARAGITAIFMNDKQKSIIEKKLAKKSTKNKKQTNNNDNTLNAANTSNTANTLYSDIGIIKINNKKLDELRTCFLFMDLLNDEQVIIRTLKTSGTIKSLITKFNED